MRLLFYISILAVGFAFFLNSYKNTARDEIVENVSENSENSVNQNISNNQTRSDILTSSDTPSSSEPSVNQKTIDQNTLDKIQESLNRAGQAIKEIERKNEEASRPKAEPKTRLSQSELYGKAESRVVNFFCNKRHNWSNNF